MWKWIALAVFVIVLSLGTLMALKITPPGESPIRFLFGLASYGGQAREGTLQVGDPAPDVTLFALQGSEDASRLGEWFGARPVVLVFGSFT